MLKGLVNTNITGFDRNTEFTLQDDLMPWEGLRDIYDIRIIAPRQGEGYSSISSIFDLREGVMNGDYNSKIVLEYLPEFLQRSGNNKLTYKQAQEMLNELNEENRELLKKYYEGANVPMPEIQGLSLFADYKDAKQLLVDQAVFDMIHSWAISSNDDNTFSLATHKLVADIFNIDDHAEWNDFAEIDELIKNNSKTMKAFIESQYEATQEKLRDLGISYVKVYRGMKFDEMFEDDKYKLATSLANSDSNEVEVALRPLSSFSSSENTADGFSEGGYLEYDGEEIKAPSILIDSVIPASQIFSSAMTGFGCLFETELVVLGPSVAGKIYGDWSEFKKISKQEPTVENPEPGGIIGRDDLGNPIYKDEV
jgi:hypothetical protein